jgi:stress response protein SCP2
MRKEMDIIAYGDIKTIDEQNPAVLAYERTYQSEKMLVVCNFYRPNVKWDSKINLERYNRVLGNYSEPIIHDSVIELRPYEAIVLYKEDCTL